MAQARLLIIRYDFFRISERLGRTLQAVSQNEGDKDTFSAFQAKT